MTSESGEEARPAVDVSVLVVSFNTRKLTLDCIHSIYEQTSGLSFEVLVVDNASEDESAEAVRSAFPQVDLMALSQNIGFARANNLAAQAARGKYLLLLNPDTVILDGALQKLHYFMETHPDAGACGGRTYLGDGSLDPGSCWGRITPWSAFCGAVGLSRLFRGTRLLDPESLGWWNRDSLRSVDIITGCLLIVSRELWEDLKGFDPRFFMYCEDADLCMRISSLDRRNWLLPEAEIIHFCGASEKVRADKMVRLFCAKSLLFRKHWTSALANFGIWTLSFHAGLRMATNWFFKAVSPSRSQAFETWRTVWRRRREWNLMCLEDMPVERVTERMDL